MPYGAQKDKEFPRLLCPCNNLLLFRAQRNRRVPHGSTPHRGRGTGLFHLSEHRCPSLSTLAGPLSKQLVNVLGPRSAIERAEIGNSRPMVVRVRALLDPYDTVVR